MNETLANLPRQGQRVAVVLTLWAGAVVVAAGSGALGQIAMPLIAPLVAAGIALPTAWYVLSPGLRAWVAQGGLYRLTAFHVWRVPAALMFFWYGSQGLLPTAFWLLAGVGDLLAGLIAAWVVSRPAPSAAQYRAMHLFGFADFLVAVGTGLSFTLLQDPRMAPVAALPLALIPLFGVGVSGATHLIAFDLLRRAR